MGLWTIRWTQVNTALDIGQPTYTPFYKYNLQLQVVTIEFCKADSHNFLVTGKQYVYQFMKQYYVHKVTG